MNISSNRRRLLFPVALGCALLAGSAWSQGIPNPLVRPSTQAAPPADAAAQQRGATAAPAQGRPGARAAADGEGLPAEGQREKTVSERLENLYVSAVIGDRAVLRSLEVRTVPPLASNNASGGALSGGTRSGETAGGGGGSGGGGGTGAAGNVAGLRSQMFVVRNGEVLPYLDRTRLLVRVRDTTVTLFDVTDIPPGNYDPLDLMDRGFPVAFRGSVDSVQASPPTPAALIAPGGGVDGAAFDRARDTSGNNGSTGTGGTNNTNRSGSGSGGTGNP